MRRPIFKILFRIVRILFKLSLKMIDKLNECIFLRDSWVEYKVVFLIDVAFGVVAQTAFFFLGGERPSTLSTIRLLGCVVFGRSFALHSFGCSFLSRSFTP